MPPRTVISDPQRLSPPFLQPLSLGWSCSGISRPSASSSGGTVCAGQSLGAGVRAVGSSGSSAKVTLDGHQRGAAYALALTDAFGSVDKALRFIEGRKEADSGGEALDNLRAAAEQARQDDLRV